MAKIKYTKTEQKNQQDALKQFQRFLPTLQLKKQQLQQEVRQSVERVEANREAMKALSVKYDAPVIIGGDYNCNLSSDPLKIILQENKFVEAENLATKTEFGGTHHSYPTFNTEVGYADKYYPAGGTYKTAIDHIFIYNESKLNVHLYDVIEDYFALASSDHCPMITDITLK